ncbi:MAG: adenylosuccinate lyase [Ilumatobacteraceae bacterium]|nr:adenylosuccinate lyase [Ilumatobacteraceae bacterium]
MIDRYSTPEMSGLFTEQAKMQRWLDIELAVTDALAAQGIVPPADAQACRAGAPRINAEFVAEVEARERTTDHDVAAFVDVVQGHIGAPHGAWIHLGLTSSDVVDTGWCWALRDAADLIIGAQKELRAVLVALAQQHRNTAMIGRTHGIHAEPTTFGAKVALWALQVDRDHQRMCAARTAIAVCKLSGAVGTYSNIDPSIETAVAATLGLQPVPATQVIARDRHAEYLWACASIGTTLEAIAVELRHLQRTEVSEVREGFKVGQKGSSAMPHKRNPISAETITGLSRVLRANLQVGLQDVALWHERDISHSSAERVVLPDSSALTFYVLKRMIRLITNLEVDTQRMTTNLDMLKGLVYSQSVLLALVQGGMQRDDAYRVVQEASNITLTTGQHFRDVLSADSRVVLSAAQLDSVFDLSRVLRHASSGIDSLNDLAKS